LKVLNTYPVGQTMLDSVTGQFVTVSCCENLVSADLRCDELSDDVLVCEANNKAVLGRIVSVLCLGSEAYSHE
jgi:hypothetical protein